MDGEQRKNLKSPGTRNKNREKEHSFPVLHTEEKEIHRHILILYLR
jgi:hypothetical protein